MGTNRNGTQFGKREPPVVRSNNGAEGRNVSNASTSNASHMNVIVQIAGKEEHAMIDSGAQINLISPDIVKRLHIPWRTKKTSYAMTTIEGDRIKTNNGRVTRETAQLPVTIAGRAGRMSFDITNIGDRSIILGAPWLRQWNPRIDWANDQLYWETTRQGASLDIRKDVTTGGQSKEKDNRLGKRAHGKLQELAAREPKDSIAGRYIAKYPELFQEELDTRLPEHS